MHLVLHPITIWMCITLHNDVGAYLDLKCDWWNSAIPATKLHNPIQR